MPDKKLRIGWFSFTCCEDSTIVLTEMLNDHYEEWSKKIDFRHIRVLKKNNSMENLDVAFVEGAIASDKDAEELKKIRANCRKLVAIGSCAIVGMPAAQRNEFDAARKKEIEFLLKKFKQARKVRTLYEIVKVDDKVAGCPMFEKSFLEVLDKCFREFGVK
ncbi:hypothetical protein J4453_02555 [Candidatus Woesearchaeota archaeon]|nr:hypothetical protein [Candidatus Woesearchaeota archaeon]